MKHLLVTVGAAVALFAMLWFGVVVLELTPGMSLVASFLTLGILGLGLLFASRSSDQPDEPG